MKTMTPIKQAAMTSVEFDRIFTKLKTTAKLTPEQIADGLGVSRVSLYRWAAGSRKIDKFTAQAIRLYAADQLS